VLLVNDLFFFNVDAGVELREDLESRGADFECDCRDGHLAARFFGLGSETGAQLLEFGDVSTVVLGHMRNRVPGFGHMLRGLPPNAAHRYTFDLAPLREIRKVRLGEVTGAWCSDGCSCGGEQRFGISLHIIFADPSTGASAFDFIDVNTDLAREAANVGGSRNRLPVLGSSDFVKLRG